MVSITFSLDDALMKRFERFEWINWSALAREEAEKREIFETFIRTGELSKRAREFCDKLDWHPVDELALKDEIVKQLKESLKKNPSGKSMAVNEFDEWCKSL